jgi:DNA-binding MarR family transcriptional regulator
MGPSGSPPRHTLITLVRAALADMVDDLIARLHAAGHTGIRRAHSAVFENLDRDGTRLTALAERAHMTHPAMSELVGSVERLGYVERVPDPTDGRARIVRFTPAGRALQRFALAEIAKIETAWSRRLGPVVGPELMSALLRAIAEPEVPDPPPPRARPGTSRAER